MLVPSSAYTADNKEAPRSKSLKASLGIM
jgi:hypothetical protein